MGKLILLSVVLALVIVPIVAASDRDAGRGLKRAVFAVVAFNLFYAFALRYLFPRFSG